jgi:hypothetical protein
MTEPKVTALCEKAMLVKLTQRRVNLTRRDQAAETVIQQQMDDSSLTVLSRLFRDQNNPVKKALSHLSETYTYHKKHTLPYIDKGPRILVNGLYLDYSNHMRARRNELDTMMASLMPNYDSYVQQDILQRSKTSTRATAADYPSASEFFERVGFDVRFTPLPDERHFLFDLSEEDQATFANAMKDVHIAATNDAIGRMLTPLRHLVDKLNKPIGTDGAVFRDSAVENVAEGLEIARKLLMDAPPHVVDTMAALDKAVSVFAGNKDWLRESPIMREQAAKKLDDIARQMGSFMGA